jgi:hypothetical protein
MGQRARRVFCPYGILGHFQPDSKLAVVRQIAVPYIKKDFFILAGRVGPRNVTASLWLANCYFSSRRACHIVTFCRRVSADRAVGR